MRVSMLFFAFFATVSAEPFIEEQDPSMKDIAPAETNEKRWHNWCSVRCSYGRYCQSGYYCDYYRCCRPNHQRPCSHHAHCPQGWYCDYNARKCKVGERRCSHPYHCSRDQVCVDGKCRKRECYSHNQCRQGYYCDSGICKALCTSDSSCKDTQCCLKYYSSQQYGYCRELKKPGEFCPMKRDGYHCGCTKGYQCVRYYNNYYWGKCKPKPCASDSSCKKTHCCSGGKCKPRKKAGEFCPRKGADIYHCGCIEGFNCKQYQNSHYWGKCEKIVPPTEEPGSGFQE